MVRTFALAVTAAGLCLGSVDANAQSTDSGKTLTLVSASAWGSNANGGPFEVDPSFGGHTATGKFGASEGNFISFCLERDEFVTEGTTYNVQIGTSASNGGFGGGNPDPLDERTAFLYTKFAEGTFADDFNAWSGSTFEFTYLDTYDGEILQDAIWIIEDEKPLKRGDDDRAFQDEIIAWAEQAVADGGEWFGRGLGSVRVMTLTNLDGTPAQDMITIVPLPMPVALGLAGLFGVGIMTRMRRGINA
ncbi:MAG: hypothetical protein ACOC0P_03655 [Planctomycetota bacterium]